MTLVLLYFGLPLGLLLLGFMVGKTLELLHIRSLEQREDSFRAFPVTNFRNVPEGWAVADSFLVDGQVVISADQFKTAISGIRKIFGGGFRSLETIMDRARREALLRLQEKAREQGADAVWNVRFETSTIANGGVNNQRRRPMMTAEIYAYGTAIRFREGASPLQ